MVGGQDSMERQMSPASTVQFTLDADRGSMLWVPTVEGLKSSSHESKTLSPPKFNIQPLPQRGRQRPSTAKTKPVPLLNLDTIRSPSAGGHGGRPTSASPWGVDGVHSMGSVNGVAGISAAERTSVSPMREALDASGTTVARIELVPRKPAVVRAVRRPFTARPTYVGVDEAVLPASARRPVSARPTRYGAAAGVARPTTAPVRQQQRLSASRTRQQTFGGRASSNKGGVSSHWAHQQNNSTKMQSTMSRPTSSSLSRAGTTSPTRRGQVSRGQHYLVLSRDTPALALLGQGQGAESAQEGNGRPGSGVDAITSDAHLTLPDGGRPSNIDVGIDGMGSDGASGGVGMSFMDPKRRQSMLVTQRRASLVLSETIKRRNSIFGSDGAGMPVWGQASGLASPSSQSSGLFTDPASPSMTFRDRDSPHSPGAASPLTPRGRTLPSRMSFDVRIPTPSIDVEKGSGSEHASESDSSVSSVSTSSSSSSVDIYAQSSDESDNVDDDADDDDAGTMKDASDTDGAGSDDEAAAAAAIEAALDAEALAADPWAVALCGVSTADAFETVTVLEGTKMQRKKGKGFTKPAVQTDICDDDNNDDAEVCSPERELLHAGGDGSPVHSESDKEREQHGSCSESEDDNDMLTTNGLPKVQTQDDHGGDTGTTIGASEVVAGVGVTIEMEADPESNGAELLSPTSRAMKMELNIPTSVPLDYDARDDDDDDDDNEDTEVEGKSSTTPKAPAGRRRGRGRRGAMIGVDMVSLSELVAAQAKKGQTAEDLARQAKQERKAQRKLEKKAEKAAAKAARFEKLTQGRSASATVASSSNTTPATHSTSGSTPLHRRLASNASNAFGVPTGGVTLASGAAHDKHLDETSSQTSDVSSVTASASVSSSVEPGGLKRTISMKSIGSAHSSTTASVNVAQSKSAAIYIAEVIQAKGELGWEAMRAKLPAWITNEAIEEARGMHTIETMSEKLAAAEELMSEKKWRQVVLSLTNVITGTLPFMSVDIPACSMASRPIVARAMFLRGRVYLALGLPQEGLGDLNDAVEIDPNMKQAVFERVVCLMALGRNEEAAKDLVKIQKGLNQAFDRGLIAGGRSTVAKETMARVAPLFSRLNVTATKWAYAQRQRDLERTRNNAANFIDKVQKTTEMWPAHEITAFVDRVNTCLSRGDTMQANHVVIAALATDEGAGIVYCMRGRVKTAEGKYNPALEDFTVGIALWPECHYCFLYRAAATRQSDPDAAKADATRCLQLENSTGEAHIVRGRVMEAEGQWIAAERDYLAAAGLSENKYMRTRLRLYCATQMTFEQMRAKQALPILNLTLNTDQNCMDAIKLKAATHLALGDRRSAIREYSRALRLDPSQAPLYAARARCLTQLGQLSAGAFDCIRYCEMFKGRDAVVAMLHVKTLLVCSMTKRALLVVDNYCSVFHGNIELTSLKGLAQLLRGNFDAARMSFELAIKLITVRQHSGGSAKAASAHPEAENTFLWYGMTMLRLGLHNAAYHAFASSIAANSENEYASHGQGLAQIGLGQFKLAEKTLSRALKIRNRKRGRRTKRRTNPNPEIFERRAQLRIKNAKRNEALADFRAAIDIRLAERFDGVRADTLREQNRRFIIVGWINCGLCNMLLYQYAAAVIDFTEALKLDPANDKASYLRGVSYHVLAFFKEAVSDYTVTLSSEPRHMQTIEFRLLARWRLNDIEGALEDYETLLELCAIDVFTEVTTATMMAVAHCHFVQDDVALALKIYDGIVKHNPNNTEALTAKAKIRLAQLHNPQFNFTEEEAKSTRCQAVRELSRAVHTDPTYSHAWLCRACIQVEDHDWPEASRLVSAALKLAPNDGDALAARAMLRYSRGEYAGADEDVETALAFAGDGADRSQMLVMAQGVLRERELDMDTARSFYHKSIDMDGKDTGAMFNLGTTRMMEGRRVEAGQLFAQVLEIDRKHVGALVNRGIIHILSQKIDAGVSDFNTALEHCDPAALGSVQLNVATALGLSGQRAQADVAFERAVDLMTLDPDVYRARETHARRNGEVANALINYGTATWLTEGGDLSVLIGNNGTTIAENSDDDGDGDTSDEDGGAYDMASELDCLTPTAAAVLRATGIKRQPSIWGMSANDNIAYGKKTSTPKKKKPRPLTVDTLSMATVFPPPHLELPASTGRIDPMPEKNLQAKSNSRHDSCYTPRSAPPLITFPISEPSDSHSKKPAPKKGKSTVTSRREPSPSPAPVMTPRTPFLNRPVTALVFRSQWVAPTAGRRPPIVDEDTRESRHRPWAPVNGYRVARQRPATASSGRGHGDTAKTVTWAAKLTAERREEERKAAIVDNLLGGL